MRYMYLMITRIR